MIDWTRNLVLPAQAADLGLSYRGRALLLVGAGSLLAALYVFARTQELVFSLVALVGVWLAALVGSPLGTAGDGRRTLRQELLKHHGSTHLLPLDDAGQGGVLVATEDGSGPLAVPVRGGLRQKRAFAVKLDDGRTVPITEERFALVARLWRSHRLREGDRVVVWDYRREDGYRTASESYGARTGWVVLRLASHGG
ncbi:MAG: hypothetical protein AAF645_23400 [Myxococcota bacterium]